VSPARANWLSYLLGLSRSTAEAKCTLVVTSAHDHQREEQNGEPIEIGNDRFLEKGEDISSLAVRIGWPNLSDVSFRMTQLPLTRQSKKAVIPAQTARNETY
jgi:hypothetical protein